MFFRAEHGLTCKSYPIRISLYKIHHVIGFSKYFLVLLSIEINKIISDKLLSCSSKMLIILREQLVIFLSVF